MKRRIFISTTGIMGTFATTGFATTSSLFTPTAPWRFNEKLDEKFVESLDVFALRIKDNLQDVLNCNKLMKNLVTPKKVISQDPENGIFVYENYAANQVSISKKNGEIVVRIL